MSKRLLNDAQVEYLITSDRTNGSKALQKAFNQKFGTDFTCRQLQGQLHEIGKAHLGTLCRYKVRYSQEEIEFLRNSDRQLEARKLYKLFIAKFGRHIAYKSFLWRLRALGIPIDIPKARPLGAETIVHGYVHVKISMAPSKWKLKHVLIWEQTHGPVPKGYRVLFADQNRQNFSPDNLLLVSLEELMIMDYQGLISTDPEITRTALNIARLTSTVKRRRKQQRE